MTSVNATTLPLCSCGCGQRVKGYYTKTRAVRSQRKGEPHRYIVGHGPKRQHLTRFVFVPLDVGATTAGLARELGVPRRQVYRWRQYGVTTDQADRLAARLGHHPGELWAEWWEVAG